MNAKQYAQLNEDDHARLQSEQEQTRIKVESMLKYAFTPRTKGHRCGIL